MSARAIALSYAFASALMVAACSGGGPTISGPSGGVGGPALTQTNLNLSPEEVATSGPVRAFNPFEDTSSQPTGGREVIANPSLAEVLAPSGLPEIAFGQADAPVTIVEYASLTCPFCKRFHAEVYPVLKRDYIDTGKVRYILREFPIGRTSGQGNVALRCAAPVASEKYLELFGRFLAEQPAWVSQEVNIDRIAAVAAKSGLTRAAYDACRADVALIEGLKSVKDRGRKLGIIGTPNFFIQDKLIKKAVGIEELRAAIDPLLAARTASAASQSPTDRP
jgi:protein-disulfide isomerase